MLPASESIARCKRCIDQASVQLSRQTTEAGRVDGALLKAHQVDVFSLAHHLANLAAAQAMLDWSAQHTQLEQDLTRTWCAMVTSEVFSWLEPRWDVLGVARVQPDPGGFVATTLESRKLASLGKRVLEEGSGATGIDGTHAAIREAFSRFSDAELAPHAEQIHRQNTLVPESILQALADLGVFGISIPESYGGTHLDHLAMIIATEELSRGSLGAGGSVITRPEICARALLAGGTEQQKQRWLPAIASGQHMVSVAVTEPDAGSDVASVRCTAQPTQGGYRINGEKTWCTFAGRADLLLLLARTSDEGHKGLSLFVVDKPPTLAGDKDEHSFSHQRADGSSLTGQAIGTIGYRGMHSFAIQLDDWFVAEDQRIGPEGKGFYLMMEGFSGGRIQTAARAIGVMEAALREACTYVQERRVFGENLSDMPLTQVKIAQMTARLQASRQLAYATGRKMGGQDDGVAAALVKLLSCRQAEWVTREAMQLHGGMGYAEEYPVSRYWLDARVLSIFEGAEEVLAIRVIGRAHLNKYAQQHERIAQ